MSFLLHSPAFVHNGTLPAKYTCDGEGISPPLEIQNPPLHAKSLVLIMDDPDAENGPPAGGWVHWLLFNIPPETEILEEGKEPPGIAGRNSWGKVGYGGACPPSGTHRYVCTVYALNIELTLPVGSEKEAVLAACQGHIISEAQLIGMYGRE
ncbi:MAG: YbhB/YbcL family Raf kinase inhibitor-like protein [bacterium]|nr:YbhB/YbcL family Raf kinase inhibitor-like protein [bacterium]